MLEMTGAGAVTNKTTTISAIKKRPSGAQHRRNRRGGENVLWHRVTANFDEAVKRFAANPEIASPITRLVFFKHLTTRQGMAARRYRDIVQKFDRFHVNGPRGVTKSADLEPVRKAKDDEITRQTVAGTIDDYESEAKKARLEYRDLQRVLARYADPVTGRNMAKSVLDDLCLSDIEPPTEWRANLASVLTGIAQAFGIEEKRSGR